LRRVDYGAADNKSCDYNDVISEPRNDAVPKLLFLLYDPFILKVAFYSVPLTRKNF